MRKILEKNSKENVVKKMFVLIPMENMLIVNITVLL